MDTTNREYRAMRLTAGDFRRALALMKHYYDEGDEQGCRAVIEDAGEAERVTELIMALYQCHSQIVTQIVCRDCASMDFSGISDTIHAEIDSSSRPARAYMSNLFATRLLRAFADEDPAAVNTALEAAVDAGLYGYDLIMAILRIHFHMWPELVADEVVAELGHAAMFYAAHENTTT